MNENAKNNLKFDERVKVNDWKMEKRKDGVSGKVE